MVRPLISLLWKGLFFGGLVRRYRGVGSQNRCGCDIIFYMDTSSPRPLDINFMTQDPNEEVYYTLRKSFVINLPWMVFLLISLFLPVIFSVFSERFSFWTDIPPATQLIICLFWYLAVLGYGLMNLARWYFHVFLITSKRVMDIDLVGFLYRNVAEAQLKHIQDVSHTQGGLFQLLFNYGDVYIQTAATRQNIELVNVPHPGQVHDTVTDIVAQVNGRVVGKELNEREESRAGN